MVAIIPAYEPEQTLVEVVNNIRKTIDCDIVVVDDGSGPEYGKIFGSLPADVVQLVHEKNRGKGAAIKTALSYIWEKMPKTDSVITIDCDGQHTVEDMIRIQEKLTVSPDALVLGCRAFENSIPFRSRLGNTVTRYVFKSATGVMISDTQTGLRGFSRAQIPFMVQTPGDRYEYEINVLLEWAKGKRPIVEVPIATIYLNGNQSSHFRPIRDSIIVYKEIIKFSCASLLSFVVDFILFALFSALLAGVQGGLIISNIVARIFSACFNFYLNKHYVFQSKGSLKKEALQYGALAVLVLTANTIVLKLLVTYVIHWRLLAKIITETIMFLFSLTIQKMIIFKNGERRVS